MLRWSRDPLRASLFLLLLVTVSRVHQHFPFVAAARPALFLSGATLAYALLNPRLLGTGEWVRTWPARAVIALGVLACLSAPFGISLGGSARFFLEDYSKVLVVALLLMATIRGAPDVHLIVWAYVVSCGILAAMGLFVFETYKAAGSVVRLNNLYTYDANDLGCVLLVGLPLALLAFQTAGMRGKLFCLLVLAGIGAALARSGSRGAFVGLLAVGAALLFVLKGIALAKRVAFVVVTGLALLVGAPPGYWQQMGTLKDPKADYNWEAEFGRRKVAERGLRYLLQRPVFGIGIANFPRAEGTMSDYARRWRPDLPGVKWSAAHNSFIQVGAELGVPGLVLFAGLVLGGPVALWRLRRRLPARWARGDPEERFLYLSTVYVPVAFVAFAVTGFFLSFAYMDPPYILAALVAGIHLSVRAKLRGGAGGSGGARAGGVRLAVGRAWRGGGAVPR